MVGFTIFCFRNWSLHDISRAFPLEGASGAGSDRWAIFSPTCGTGGLNLMLDVLSSTEGFEHAVDALLLLFKIGMDIEIERRADVGVAQYDAHGLVVAVARTNFASEKIVHE